MEELSRWLARIASAEHGQEMVEHGMITMPVSVAIVPAAILEAVSPIRERRALTGQEMR